jgi:hypothetical protein
MNAIASVKKTPSGIDSKAATASPLRRLARVTGVLYLVLAMVGMVTVMTLESVNAGGDPAATARNVLERLGMFEVSMVGWVVIITLDALIAVTLYLVLEPASRTLALVTAALRGVYTVVLGGYLMDVYAAHALLTGPLASEPGTLALAGADIEAFATGFMLALVFFGLHLVALGVTLVRSRAVPRVLSALLLVAGIGYIIDSFATFFVAGHGGVATAVLVAPAVAGEFGLALWLIIKGVALRAPAGREGASVR